MDGTAFVNTINAYGEDKVIAIICDNSTRKFFPNLDFTLAENFDSTLQTLMYIEQDPEGNSYLTTKHVENVQGIIFATANTNVKQLDSRWLSS